MLGDAKIDVRWNTEVKEFIGADSKLNQLRLVNNQSEEEERFPVDGAFIFIGLNPNTGFLENSDVLLDRWGYVVTGHALLHKDPKYARVEREPYMLETSVPGVFAAGDVRDGSTKQVVSAAGEGSAAALFIREYLKHV